MTSHIKSTSTTVIYGEVYNAGQMTSPASVMAYNCTTSNISTASNSSICSSLLTSSSSSTADEQKEASLLLLLSPQEVLVALALSAIIIVIVVGNVLVVLSVTVYKDMRKLSNALIGSLATADLLVAIFVLPLSVHVELAGGPHSLAALSLCSYWITADIFCCSASILNIVVIALDRYWLITRNVSYTHGKGAFTRKPVCLVMVIVAWLAAAVISATPLVARGSGNECAVSQDRIYTLFSTTLAFWLPLALIVFIYAKLFRVAQRRVKMRSRWQAAREAVLLTQHQHQQQQQHAPLLLASPPAVRCVDSAAKNCGDETAALAAENGDITPQGEAVVLAAVARMKRLTAARSDRLNRFRAAAAAIQQSNVEPGEYSNADNTMCCVELQPQPTNGNTSVHSSTAVHRTLPTTGKQKMIVRRQSATTLSVSRMRSTARMLGLIIGGFVML